MTGYTDERNAQMLIYLLKEHGIKKVIVSPGATNVCFVASLQNDSFFELYSSIDERSAAYIACGMAAESGEPVALSCTGATASRNYVPALTEAYYRKLPVLTITSSRALYKIGQLEDQITDRTCPMKDIALLSVQIPTINTEEEEWAYGVQMNKALLELKRRGGGPVHINLVTTYNRNYTTTELKPVKVINRICIEDTFPELKGKKVVIFIGSHSKWTYEFTNIIDEFCELHDAYVLSDVTSNYRGKYGIPVAFSRYFTDEQKNVDVMIHMGEISGLKPFMNAEEVWRVCPDGEVRDTYHSLRYVFEMEERFFFKHYVNDVANKSLLTERFRDCRTHSQAVLDKLPELPFSNLWMAQYSHELIPHGAVLHLGILNSLRSWSYFEVDKSVDSYSNTGGYGIDGGVSSTIGASLVHPEKLFFCILGDLAFFYDMNSLGNRHIGNNIRILIVNNGRGCEFRLASCPAAQFGDETDKYISAAGHYGNKSPNLVKHYAEDLGFEYLTADSKENFIEQSKRFFTNNITEKPMVFETFVDYKDDAEAARLIEHIPVTTQDSMKNAARNILGDKRYNQLKKLIKS